MKWILWYFTLEENEGFFWLKRATLETNQKKNGFYLLFWVCWAPRTLGSSSGGGAWGVKFAFSPLWNDFVQGLMKWLQRNSLKPYLLSGVTPDLEVVFDVQIYGRAQYEKRELFKQKNAASTIMKECSCTVSGVLMWSWLGRLRERRALMISLLWKSQQRFQSSCWTLGNRCLLCAGGKRREPWVCDDDL